MNQFYESSSLRTCPDGSRGCLIQEYARDLHLCVKIEIRRRAKRGSFQFLILKAQESTFLFFSISYLLIIKEYSLPLAFWCTFHFWHLLYMQYPVVLCPEKKKTTQNEALTELLNQTVFVAKSNSLMAALVQCGDNMSGRCPASKLPVASGLWLSVELVCVQGSILAKCVRS